ncbi:MAG: hypothetical protein K6T80_04710 [Firmicutes bacterium]|nr:hypothetical protein [Bacillota bacterium]
MEKPFVLHREFLFLRKKGERIMEDPEAGRHFTIIPANSRLAGNFVENLSDWGVEDD